jgi:hypothetical protein
MCKFLVDLWLELNRSDIITGDPNIGYKAGGLG